MTLPNIVLLVMDCVRASDFPGGSDDAPTMPVVEGLRKESVEFPRAVSAAPWTIPSHASLFTGLYPWEHGDHGLRSLVLDSELPTLPKLLRRHGYRSGSFSANSLICPVTGLTHGFDFVTWGNMSDMFLRFAHGADPPHAASEGSTGIPVRRPSLHHLLSRIPFEELPIRAQLERRIAAPAYVAQLREKLRRCDQDDGHEIARWIEPTMERFIRSVPADAPVFCFVNLVDAHEPYFPDPEVLRRHGGALGFVRLRQDRVGWLDPDRASNRWDLAFLHDLYRAAIRRTDRRIGRIVELLQRTGRWEDTLFVITSDHGQAFGEHGMLFHRFRVDDPLVRVPLLVRMPHGRHAGAVGKGWASPVDLAPTCLDLVEDRSSVRLPGTRLEDLVDAPRPDPVFAVHDGTLGDRWVPQSRRAELERVAVAAFQGDTKVVVQFSPTQHHSFDLRTDPAEAHDTWGDHGGELRELAGRAEAVGQALAALPKARTDFAVQYRLESWGYI